MMESYENSKAPSYLDVMDNTHFSYIDSGLDYLQYPPSSPPFMSSMTLGATTTSPAIGFNALNLSTGLNDYAPPSAPFGNNTPTRPYTPVDGASVSPPMLSYHLSAGELSSDSRSNGSHSPPIPYAATVPRSHRFNPIAAPATRASARNVQKRKLSKNDDDSDDDDEDFQPTKGIPTGTETRRETIRRQRIESEQRRRDELRDGYARLKDTLPASNQKASKVSLLDRATTHIRNLDALRSQLEASLKSAENEVNRLRNVNEALMLGAASQRVNGSPLVNTVSF